MEEWKLIEKNAITTTDLQWKDYKVQGKYRSCMIAGFREIVERFQYKYFRFSDAQSPARALSEYFKGMTPEMAHRKAVILSERYFIKMLNRIAEDLIMNNVVVILPFNTAYLVVAKDKPGKLRSMGLKEHIHLHMIYMPNATRFNVRFKAAYFNQRWNRLLKKEIATGHEYPYIGEVITKMKNYA